jgi:NTE family protein
MAGRDRASRGNGERGFGGGGRRRELMRLCVFIASTFAPFKWLFRLPWSFSIPFVLISLAWMLYGFDHINTPITGHLHNAVTRSAQAVAYSAQHLLPTLIGQSLVDAVQLKSLDQFTYSLITTFVFLAGLAIAYNLAAAVNLAVVWLNWKPTRDDLMRPQVLAAAAAGWQATDEGLGAIVPIDGGENAPAAAIGDNPLTKIESIGIVLSGGGAKGAFQAGAMRAIYEFLDQCGALSKVKVIASTSIGSWNALFWLANLIDPATGSGGQSIHEQWWRKISMRSLVAPSPYLPFCHNAFLSSKPWQQVFDRLFDNDAVKKRIAGSDIHFYMTRSNVRSGELECATNNQAPHEVNNVIYDVLKPRELGPEKFLREIKSAVFASMDIPPLFPYTLLRGKLYEDGGLIDNLPLSFPATDQCDLLFVLSLNADFEAEPNYRSVIARLSRVLDVQQGALERQSFKMIYLFKSSPACEGGSSG